MRVIVALDPLRHASQTECATHGLQQLGLAGGFGQAALQGLTRIGFGVQDDRALFATDGDGQGDAAAGLERQRLLHQRRFGDVVVQQHGWRRRFVVIELGQERHQHRVQIGVARMGREKRAVAVIAPAADEEDLHARLPADLMPGDDIGVHDAVRVDDGRTLDMRQAADPIAKGGGALELQALGRLLHLLGQRLLHVAGLAAQKRAGLIDQLPVLGFRDPADTGGAAALDLVQ